MAAIASWYKKSDSPMEQSQKLSKIVDIAHDLKVSKYIISIGYNSGKSALPDIYA